MTPFLGFYIAVALAMTIGGAVVALISGDADPAMRKTAARVALCGLIWPVMLPLGVWALVCYAFDRQFPTFEEKR